MTALTAEDPRDKVLKQNAMQAETYLAELHVKLSRADELFICAHKNAIEQITKCRKSDCEQPSHPWERVCLLGIRPCCRRRCRRGSR